MPLLDPRQKAERIVELFRSRRPTEILPAEVYPASLDEAYAIRRCFQEIEEATGRACHRRLQDRPDDAGHAAAVRDRGALLRRDLCARGACTAEPSSAPATTAASGSRPRSCSASARTSRTAAMPGRVAAAVESAAAAIELIEDLRYDYRRLDAAAMVAGNVWSAGAVARDAGQRSGGRSTWRG
mgnify:CR=1 FL=1